MITKFDSKDIYTNEIESKVAELLQLCNKYRLPMFLTIAVKNDEEGTEYVKEMFAAKSNSINLKDDYLRHLVNVMNGFSTIPPADDIEIDFE